MLSCDDLYGKVHQQVPAGSVLDQKMKTKCVGPDVAFNEHVQCTLVSLINIYMLFEASILIYT